VYRFACANAGDSLLDANFEVATANNAIILLTKEEEWSKAMILDNTNKQVLDVIYNTIYTVYTLLLIYN
jgi:leucyl-tRNA synthetase